MFSLSIVIPASQNAQHVLNTASTIADVGELFNLDYEIILINDGSGSLEAVSRRLEKTLPNFKLVFQPQTPDSGAALPAGFAAARKPWLLVFPAGPSYNFSEITRLLKQADQADIVCGYRTGRCGGFLNRVDAAAWKRLVQAWFGYLCRDIECGVRLYRRETLEELSFDTNGTTVDIELLASARARGLRIAEAPLSYQPPSARPPTPRTGLLDMIQILRAWSGFKQQLKLQLSSSKL